MAHLFTGHIPVVASGFCLLLFIFGMLLHSARVQRIGLFFITLTALTAVWAYLSGPGAEEIILARTPAAQATINAHKEAAATAFVSLLITGVISFAGLLIRRAERYLPNWYTLVVTLLLIISFALLIGAAGIGLKVSRPWLQKPVPIEEVTPTESNSAQLDPLRQGQIAFELLVRSA